MGRAPGTRGTNPRTRAAHPYTVLGSGGRDSPRVAAADAATDHCSAVPTEHHYQDFFHDNDRNDINGTIPKKSLYKKITMKKYKNRQMSIKINTLNILDLQMCNFKNLVTQSL